MTKKYQVFLVTFLCYTAIHSLRTAFSSNKKRIALQIAVQTKYMGIIDALMLLFLGLGHYLHAVRPNKKPVTSLYIAMILCGINYQLIPLSLLTTFFGNFFTLSVLMSINGFLQSYTWPNLLMMIDYYFDSEKQSTLLGLWSANGNIGNIIGFGIFELIRLCGIQNMFVGFSICALYAVLQGIYIWRNFEEFSIQRVDIRKSFRIQMKVIAPIQSFESSHEESNSLGQNLIEGPLLMKDTLKVTEIFHDPQVLCLTIAFSLLKSVKYGIMLWLPLYFQSRPTLTQFSYSIPIIYDLTAILGSIFLGYLFTKFANKGLLMIPFMSTLFICFFILRIPFENSIIYFTLIGIVGFNLGGLFNTLAGLVIIQLTKAIPVHLKTKSLGFYSALTMAIGNVTTALTQILFGFVLSKQKPQSIFFTFMIYIGMSLVCIVILSRQEIKHK